MLPVSEEVQGQMPKNRKATLLARDPEGRLAPLLKMREAGPVEECDPGAAIRYLEENEDRLAALLDAASVGVPASGVTPTPSR
jgi:hypothetical protein